MINIKMKSGTVEGPDAIIDAVQQSLNEAAVSAADRAISLRQHSLPAKSGKLMSVFVRQLTREANQFAATRSIVLDLEQMTPYAQYVISDLDTWLDVLDQEFNVQLTIKSLQRGVVIE